MQLSKHRRLWQALLSLLILGLLIWLTDPLDLLSRISGAPFGRLAGWSVIYEVLVLILWSVGVLAMLRRFGEISYGDLFLAGAKLQILTLIFPGRTGDISMMYLLRHLFRARDCALVLLIDKLITLLLVSLLAWVGIGFFYDRALLLPAALVYLALIAIGVWLLQQIPQEFDGRWRDTFFAKTLHIIADMCSESARKITPVSLGLNLLCTALRILLAGISFTLILSWFGVEISLWYVILVQAVVQIATILPVTYMGIGLVEGINIHLLGMAGIDGAVVLAANLSARAVQILLYLLAAAILLWPKRQSA
ncbi:MAG: hypothetical protein EPO31_12505 [Gammaproteobacteria bacterium]|nr:MAG: hypothetical protein EPO31_12505 [Gammaproteobacteria bacterium]